MTNHDEMQADIAENKQGLAVHEAVCAERYAGIQTSFNRGEERMQRIEKKSQRIEYVLYFLLLVVIGGKDVAVRVFELLVK